jgi:predicted lipoprotein with Yx(FWY)xxD motif
MGQVTVNGQTVSVLTTVQGLTLYYDTNDATATSIACTGACAQAWPPLLDQNNTLPPAAPGTSGFTDFNGPNGNQVEVNGHPLYTYAKDTATGQVNGESVGNVWFVGTTNLTVQ